jgi:hypothetical protein
MPGREQRVTQAEARLRRDVVDVADELRRARLRAGLTLGDVAAVVRVGPSTIHRNETAPPPWPAPPILARQAAVVGLQIRLKVYPGDDPIRDMGQVRLIARFRQRIGSLGAWAFEVPIPHPFDQRALDAVLTLPGGSIGLEFHTRLADVQEQLRRVQLKKRDAGLDRMLLIVQATHANRRAIRVASPALSEGFPVATRSLLADLCAGRMPATDGVIVF